ncbi:MAG: hypothetical protein ACRD2N_04640 [Vicinamibacterales bacterium]
MRSRLLNLMLALGGGIVVTILLFSTWFATSVQTWKRRVQSGQSGQMMLNQLTSLGELSFANFGDWTDRIAKGELPFETPPRPQGVERNIVVTLRAWMDEKHYLHDLIASDRREPTVNTRS